MAHHNILLNNTKTEAIVNAPTGNTEYFILVSSIAACIDAATPLVPRRSVYTIYIDTIHYTAMPIS